MLFETVLLMYVLFCSFFCQLNLLTNAFCIMFFHLCVCIYVYKIMKWFMKSEVLMGCLIKMYMYGTYELNFKGASYLNK